MNRTTITLFVFILPVILSCERRAISIQPAEKIQVGPGPEDMVLDTLNAPPRLLISCAARREVHEPYGEIISLDLSTGKQQELPRFDEPSDMVFKPHGIFLAGDLLYVISHSREPDDHPIIIYRVMGDSLYCLEVVRTHLQHSPNALVAGEKGDIYFVNDSGKRGSLAEKIFRLRRAGIVRLSKNKNGQWQGRELASKLGYPAGINRIGDRLFAGDALLHRVHVYRITGEGLKKETEIRDLKGNDNIRIHRGSLLTPGHVKPFRFIGHAKDPSNLSPVEVFMTDPGDGSTHSLFYSDGSSISGGSTAVVYKKHLYICQVFEPFILKVAL